MRGGQHDPGAVHLSVCTQIPDLGLPQAPYQAICKFCIVKGEKGGRALEAKAGRGLVVALLLFVGIPLPGTGAWTGTLAGSILDMKFKDVVKACMGGVLLAGIIMGLASAGLLGALSTLFSVGWRKRLCSGKEQQLTMAFCR